MSAKHAADYSIFMCIARHTLPDTLAQKESTEIFIGHRNSPPSTYSSRTPYMIGMIVDGFLSFREAYALVGHVSKDHRGARELASGIVALCEYVPEYKCTTNFNVLLGIRDARFHVEMHGNMIHLVEVSNP